MSVEIVRFLDRSKPHLLLRESMKRLDQSMHAIGWTIGAIEIDLARNTARMEFKAQALGGRFVIFDASTAGVTVTREKRTRVPFSLSRARMTGGERGGWTIELLGRERFPAGVRAGLRWLARYLDDNAPKPRALVADRAFRDLLEAAT